MYRVSPKRVVLPSFYPSPYLLPFLKGGKCLVFNFLKLCRIYLAICTRPATEMWRRFSTGKMIFVHACHGRLDAALFTTLMESHMTVLKLT
jgi:hypothetical protein